MDRVRRDGSSLHRSVQVNPLIESHKQNLPNLSLGRSELPVFEGHGIVWNLSELVAPLQQCAAVSRADLFLDRQLAELTMHCCGCCHRALGPGPEYGVEIFGGREADA
jgi:hypothetical protein